MPPAAEEITEFQVNLRDIVLLNERLPFSERSHIPRLHEFGRIANYFNICNPVDSRMELRSGNGKSRARLFQAFPAPMAF
jgi:hypothetical protein